jgi:acyl-CoA thioesterase
MRDLREKVSRDPYLQFLGIEVDELQKGRAVCSTVITADMLNFLGYVHGGLVFSLADAAFSAASNSDHLPSVALDVSGSFLKTAKVGDRVTAEAKLIHTTRRTGVYRMEVFLGGDLLATFSGTVFRKA